MVAWGTGVLRYLVERLSLHEERLALPEEGRGGVPDSERTLGTESTTSGSVVSRAEVNASLSHSEGDGAPPRPERGELPGRSQLCRSRSQGPLSTRTLSFLEDKAAAGRTPFHLGARTMSLGVLSEAQPSQTWNRGRSSTCGEEGECGCRKTISSFWGYETESMWDRSQGSTSSAGLTALAREITLSFSPADWLQRTWRLLKAAVKSPQFDYAVGILVLLNAAQMGVQANLQSSDLSRDFRQEFLPLQVGFCAIFVSEVLMRIAIYRLRYWRMPCWTWNVFDAVVTLLQLVETVVQLCAAGSTDSLMSSLGFLRFIRLARIIRLLRMVRLIPELKHMVYLISASLLSFFWTSMLLLLMIYCFAVYFTEAATDIRQRLLATEDVRGVAAIDGYWGSIFKSVLSLFQAITGGEDWNCLLEVLKDDSFVLNATIFCFYIAFATLVMLNLVTGFFVEGAQRIVKEEVDADVLRIARKLFRGPEEQGTVLTWEEFVANVEDQQMDKLFKATDLTRKDALTVFRLLDLEDTGKLSAQDFLKGCLRLKGEARSADLTMLMHQFKLHENRSEQHQCELESSIRHIAEISSLMWGHLMANGVEHESPGDVV